MIKRGLIKDKKGSHIEIVISFAVFVSFILFMYMLSKPALVREEDKTELIEYLEPNLKEVLSGELNVLSVKTGENFNKECVRLEEFERELSNFNSTARAGGEMIESDNRLVKPDGNDFFKVYYSKQNLESEWNGGCEGTDKENFTIGLQRKREIVSKEKVNKVIENNYSKNYGKMKTNLGYPDTSDFGFGLILNNGSIIKTNKTSLGESVYAEKFPVLYFNEEAEIKSGYLQIRVW